MPAQMQGQQPAPTIAQPHSIFSTSIGQYSQSQQVVPGVRVTVNELRPTTRFNDLHEELQKIVEGVDTFILNQMKMQSECEELHSRIGEQSPQIPADVEYCTGRLATMQQALENDAAAIAHAKTLVMTDAADARLSFKAVEHMKMPQQLHQSSLWNVASQAVAPTLADGDHEDGTNNNLVSYFSTQSDDMSKKLEIYQRNISEVEAYLAGVEANTQQQMRQMMSSRGSKDGTANSDDQVRELAAVFKDFENGILGIAVKVGAAREQTQEAILGEPMRARARTGRYTAP